MSRPSNLTISDTDLTIRSSAQNVRTRVGTGDEKSHNVQTISLLLTYPFNLTRIRCGGHTFARDDQYFIDNSKRFMDGFEHHQTKRRVTVMRTDSRQMTSPSMPEDNSIPAITTAEWVAVIAIVGFFAIQAINVLRFGAPLGHDESVYALRSRDLVNGFDPVFYWSAYRAPGLPLFMAPVQLIHATEPYLRGVVAGFGSLLIVSTWWLGRTIFGRRIGLIAATGVAVSPVIIGSSTQVWPDVPGAALGMVVLAYYAWMLSRGHISPWSTVTIPLLVGITTLTRFGAPIPIGIGLIVLTISRYRVAIRYWKTVVAISALSAVVVGSILMVPATTAWAQSTAYRDAIAPLTAVADLAARKDLPWTAGFDGFWSYKGFILGGRLGGLVILTGLIAALAGFVRRRLAWGPLVVSLVIAAATTLAIGASLPGEPRYLAPVYPWMWLAVAAGLADLTRKLKIRTVIGLGSLALMVMAVSAFDHTMLSTDFNRANYQLIETVSVEIDEISEDHACSILTSYTAPVAWYSKCATFTFSSSEVRLSHSSLPQGDRFIMLVERGKRQPTDELLEAYLAEAGDVLFTTGTDRIVDVYKIAQP